MLSQSNQLDLKKLPADSIQVAVHPGSFSNFQGNPGGAASSAPAFESEVASQAPTLEEIANAFDEDEELKQLGLGPSSKGLALNKAKKKRSRSEVQQAEVAKIKEDWQAAVKALSGFPDAPKAKEIGRIDRSLNTKIREPWWPIRKKQCRQVFLMCFILWAHWVLPSYFFLGFLSSSSFSFSDGEF